MIRKTPPQGNPVVDETVLMRTAIAQVDSLTRARTWYRWVIGTLALVVTGLVIGGIMLAIDSAALSQATAGLHQAAVTNCVAGNTYRAGDEAGWRAFVRLLVANSKDPAQAQQLADPFLAYIHQLDKPRDCSHIPS